MFSVQRDNSVWVDCSELAVFMNSASDVARADWLLYGLAPLPYKGTRPRMHAHWLLDGIASGTYIGITSILLDD